MDNFNLKKYLAENKLLKENIEIYKEEAKRFFETFVDEMNEKGEIEFIPDLDTGYIDLKDNSYNVDELGSIFLNPTEETLNSFGSIAKTFKGEGGIYHAVI